MNEISDTESTSSNVIKSEREMHTVEIFEPTMKGQVNRQASKVKIYRQIDHKGTNNQILGWNKKNTQK